jgi:excisionase family DNA binding protein
MKDNQKKTAVWATMAEAQAALNCSYPHVRHLIKDHSLLAVNIARAGRRPHYRIWRESLEQLMAPGQSTQRRPVQVEITINIHVRRAK